MSQADAEILQRNTIEPALRQSDWTGAAVAAANGLNTASTSTGPSTGAGISWFGLLVALAVFALVLLALWWWTRRRRRKRREAEFAAAQRVDPVRPERVGRGADRRTRRPLQGDRGRRRQRRAHQRQRIGFGSRGIRRCADRSVQPRGRQRQDDAGTGVQRPPDPRRRRTRVHGSSAATCSPAWWSPPPRPIGNWTRKRRRSTSCAIWSSTHPRGWMC